LDECLVAFVAAFCALDPTSAKTPPWVSAGQPSTLNQHHPHTYPHTHTTHAQATRIVPLTVTCCTKESPCVPAGCFGVDIGPASSAAYRAALAECNTLLWNGPMGK